MVTAEFLVELFIDSQTCFHFAWCLYLLSLTMNCHDNRPRALNLTNTDSAHMLHDHCTKRWRLETLRSTVHNMGHITRHRVQGWTTPITKYSRGGWVAWRGLSREEDQYGLKYGLQTATFCFVNETNRPKRRIAMWGLWISRAPQNHWSIKVETLACKFILLLWNITTE